MNNSLEQIFPLVLKLWWTGRQAQDGILLMASFVIGVKTAHVPPLFAAICYLLSASLYNHLCLRYTLPLTIKKS